MIFTDSSFKKINASFVALMLIVCFKQENFFRIVYFKLEEKNILLLIVYKLKTLIRYVCSFDCPILDKKVQRYKKL